MFHRVVNGVEVLALAAVAVAVVLLFANEGGSSYTATGSSPGAQIYAANCASCHGASGGGGTGPQLAGGAAAKRFPDVADQVTFVTDGSGAMPSFGGQLSPAEIHNVVEYTRTL
jgi:mono/diheme cytochrome c family protein